MHLKLSHSRGRTVAILLGAIILSATVALTVTRSSSRPVPEGYEQTEVPGVFAKTRRVDLGTVRWGNSVVGEIPLVNATDQPISIVSTTSDCGCTVVDAPNKTLAPRNITTLAVALDPTGIDGAIHKRVAIQLAIAGKKSHPLLFDIVGAVDRTARLVVLQTNVDLGPVTAGVVARRTIMMHGTQAAIDAMPDAIDLTGDPHQLVEVSYPPGSTSAARKSVEIRYAPMGSGGAGRFDIGLIAKGVTTERADFTVIARRVASVIATPSILYLPIAADHLASKRNLTLATTGHGRILIDRVASVEGISTEFSAAAHDGSVRVQVSHSGNSPPRGPEVKHVTFELGSPERTEIVVPIVLVPIKNPDRLSEAPRVRLSEDVYP